MMGTFRLFVFGVALAMSACSTCCSEPCNCPKGPIIDRVNFPDGGPPRSDAGLVDCAAACGNGPASVCREVPDSGTSVDCESDLACL